jgi:hypothetical protein
MAPRVKAPPRGPEADDELQALIEEARRRARRRRLGVVLILAGIGAVVYVVIGRGGGGDGSASRPGPSPGGSGSAQTSPASPSSPGAPGCVLARTTGDFDGDGARDVATLVAPVAAGQGCAHVLARPFRLRVGFGSGRKLDQVLPCGQRPCAGGSVGEPFTATDLDGDGRSELAVGVGPGAAIDFVGFFRVTNRAIRALRIAREGTTKAGLSAGRAVLGGGFDSSGVSPVACLVRPDGTRVLVSIHSAPTGKFNGPWRVHRAELALRGDALHVVRVSTTTSRHGFQAPGLHLHGIGAQFNVACS